MVLAAAARPRRRLSRFLAPAALVLVLAAIAVVISKSPHVARRHPSSAGALHGPARRLPPYWIVRPGDTYAEIATETGLTTAQLEAFNPGVDPLALVVGARLNLWLHPPAPPTPPPRPRFWTVRPGDSFGLIAAKTGISLDTLEQLNPQLNNRTLQPGDRVRLRR